MSLTSRIRGSSPEDKQLQQVLRSTLPDRNLFRTVSGRPPFSAKAYQVMAAPLSPGRGHSGLVGSAFDYLARAVIARVAVMNKDGVTAWLVAEQGVRVLQQSGLLDRHTMKRVDTVFATAVRSLRAYAQREAAAGIDDIIAPCCKLARLERLARGSAAAQLMFLPDLLDSLMSNEPAEVIQDLVRLIGVFSNTFVSSGAVTSNSEVIFNPKFIAIALGGADADVFIDGTLYDFKTSKDPGYRWHDIAQLWGYYLLSETSGTYDKGAFTRDADSLLFDRKIRRLGLYKARFGEIEYVEVGAIDQARRRQAVDDFRSYMQRL